MAMRDEVNEQKNKLKGKTFKEKLGYFWDYYKVHTFVTLLVVVIASVFIHDAITAKDYGFSATLLNAYASDNQEALENEFAEYSNIDLDIYDCYIDTGSTLSYETMSEMDLAISQRLIAMAQTDAIDVVISDLEPFSNFSKGMMFVDLREELSEDEFAKFEPYFFYIDAALEEEDDMIYGEDGMPQIVDNSIDHSDPSSMKDPIPVGIHLEDSAKLKEWGCYPVKDSTPIFGFVYSSVRKDVSHLFLQYLTE